MIYQGTTYIYLGAEGMSEIEPKPREVVDADERHGLLRQALEQGLLTPLKDMRLGEYPADKLEALHTNLTIDGNGRPYWLVDLTSQPVALRNKVARWVRTVRLPE